MTDEGEESYKKDLDPAPFDYDSEGQQVRKPNRGTPRSLITHHAPCVGTRPM